MKGELKMEQYMPFVWIAFAVVMAVCEAYTSQLVSIWFVVGAVGAAITSIFTTNILIQTGVFVALTVLALIITKPLVKRFKRNIKKVSTNSDRLIGMTGVVLKDINPLEATGQVKVNGEVWTAKTVSDNVGKDTKVKVLSIEGVKLIVEPVKEN